MFISKFKFINQSKLANITSKSCTGLRFYSSSSRTNGLVVGYYSNLQLSKTSSNLIQNTFAKSIIEEIKARDLKGKSGECHVTFERSADNSGFRQIAFVGLGKHDADQNELSENVRNAVGNGVRALEERKVSVIEVDSMSHPQAAAEGAFLGAYKYDTLKTKKTTPAIIKHTSGLSENDLEKWNIGKAYAESQNWARDLASTPANLMTPTIFAEEVVRELSQFDNVIVNVYGKEFAEKHKMGLFMSVAQGSDQPLKFVEIIYKGNSSQDRPVALVGKGITFDSGGISIKPAKGMDSMKGDMGGGASVVAAMRGIAAIKAPVNVVCCVPLTENMLNGSAAKPGDVFYGMNGKSVEVLNTDAEGRLVLADALTYVVDTYNPTSVIDVATLTGAMVVALGETYSGVFTPAADLWKRIEEASLVTGDSVWRMPTHPAYLKVMESRVADLANIGSVNGAGSATAAMFLSQFIGSKSSETPGVSDPMWAHMDIAGTMDTGSSSGHQVRGMTGRPTRTLIELLRGFSGSKH
ncbi:hypothetical protein BB559_005048 [Furculomyces boomerangus]|uniref:Cytosol aminopeptidase domain-containing protein n=3 Tax=Harpellales TaxID=61421 RepID=A0A2T9YB40_9FUNG|nr:hypothetical protein BB559_005048 [Furculomyces boomerangus]PWA00067.1 hypothetical protein BB558_003887 [Smittium angustum]